MKQAYNFLLYVTIVLFIASCSIFQANLDEKYQPLASPVLTANGLLMVEYPNGIPDTVSSDNYKSLLKENYKNLYETILPYKVIINKHSKGFIVKVYQNNLLILTDWSCTENKIDCWTYNGQCNPDTVNVNCK